ncbi:hypothetical protein [Acinetobacter ursingii]|uniref:hypothetical protein n=1 Tax=Acinetobacter ursingii TaxID=108980 RepID=UPI003AF425B9
MSVAIFFFILGMIIGYVYRDSKKPKKEPVKKQVRRFNYADRQKAKVTYITDVDRVRELNHLTTNESKFMRMLQHEFHEYNIIVKNKRFYIVDKDNYPIAIFEYRDGTKQIKTQDIEDGLPLFLYKAILSSQSIQKDKLSLNK